MKLKLAGQHFTWSFLLADVSTKSFWNTLNIQSLFYICQTEPILFNIALNFENFVDQLTGTKENIRDSYIFLNSFIMYGGENVQRDQRRNIGSILFSHVIKEDGSANSHEVFRQKSLVNITVDKYDTLRRVCLENLAKLEIWIENLSQEKNRQI